MAYAQQHGSKCILRIAAYSRRRLLHPALQLHKYVFHLFFVLSLLFFFSALLLQRAFDAIFVVTFSTQCSRADRESLQILLCWHMAMYASEVCESTYPIGMDAARIGTVWHHQKNQLHSQRRKPRYQSKTKKPIFIICSTVCVCALCLQ